MIFIGEIHSALESSGIDRHAWVMLIGSHPALSHVPPCKGTNPFTGQPTEFKAPRTSAVLSIGGADAGSISWAEDGSPVLNVQATEGSADAVARVAEEVAARLGGRFRRDSQ